MQPWETSIHFFLICRIRIWNIRIVVKSKSTHIAEYKISVYLSEQFICANHGLHSEKSHPISGLDQKILHYGIIYMWIPFLHLVRLWPPFDQANMVMRMTLVNMPENVSSLHRTSIASHLNHSKSHSLWPRVLIFSTSLLTIHSTPGSLA